MIRISSKVSPNAGSVVAVEALFLAGSEVQFCFLIAMDAVILNLKLLVLGNKHTHILKFTWSALQL